MQSLLTSADPYGGVAPLLCPFSDVRFVDNPDDEVCRIALGADTGLLVSCNRALELVARVDAAVNAALRHQIENDPDGFMVKVRNAAAAMLAGGSMSVDEVCTTIEEVLFQEVLAGLDQATRTSLSRRIAETVHNVQQETP